MRHGAPPLVGARIAPGASVTERDRVQAFFRMATTYPPGDDDYLTRQDRQGPPKSSVRPDVREAWNAFSAFDSLEAAVSKILELDGLRGWLVVRYDVPVDSGIRWKRTFGPDHYSLWGDAEELKRYLSDVVVDVSRPAPPGSETRR